MDEPRFELAWTREEGAERAVSGFRRTFGTDPVGVWAAPGRVNVIGEHTDYNQGLCAPIALPHCVYAAVAPAEDDTVRLGSAQMAAGALWQIPMDEVRPGNVSGWGAYVAGTIWGMRKRLMPAPAVNGYVDSCVPFGAGLSSSAALSCAFAVAEAALAGVPDSAGLRIRLVDAARDAENQIVGAPTGGLDQSASLRSARAHVLILDFRDSTARQVPFNLASARLEMLVIDTKAPHQLNDGQYGARRASCEAAARKLGVASLREVDDLAAAMRILGPDTVEGKRARHVITEIARTKEFEQVARQGCWEELGRLFQESHDSLRYDYEVTVPELDVAVESALASGAHAARMTGGGFGGSVIAVVPVERLQRVANGVSAAFAQAGFAPPAFMIGTPSAPAARVR
jgi:galactokinase